MNHSRAYIKYCQQKRKHNLRLSFLALALLLISLITMTYCWIEGSTAINILNDNTNILIKDTSWCKFVVADEEYVANSITLSDYIDNKDNLYLAPAQMLNGVLQIKDSDATYRNVNTNDIGNNYVEFDVKIKVNNEHKFSFTDDSKIYIGNEYNKDITYPIKVALKLDEVIVGQFDNNLKRIGENSKEAFIISDTDTHNLKVIIWYDESLDLGSKYKGENVNFNFELKAENNLTKLTFVDKTNNASALNLINSNKMYVVLNINETTKKIQLTNEGNNVYSSDEIPKSALSTAEFHCYDSNNNLKGKWSAINAKEDGTYTAFGDLSTSGGYGTWIDVVELTLNDHSYNKSFKSAKVDSDYLSTTYGVNQISMYFNNNVYKTFIPKDCIGDSKEIYFYGSENSENYYAVADTSEYLDTTALTNVTYSVFGKTNTTDSSNRYKFAGSFYSGTPDAITIQSADNSIGNTVMVSYANEFYFSDYDSTKRKWYVNVPDDKGTIEFKTTLSGIDYIFDGSSRTKTDDIYLYTIENIIDQIGTWNFTGSLIPPCSEDILNGTKVSFYAGNNWGGATMYIATESTNSSYVSRGDASTTLSLNNRTYNYATFLDEDPKNYYIKQDTSWSGIQIGENAVGGKFYGVYSTGVMTGNTIDKKSATTATTTLDATSVISGFEKMPISTVTSNTKSVIGTDLIIQYYINNNLAYTSDVLTATTNSVDLDVSEYTKSGGTVTIKTVLTDGTVYYVADTDTFKVISLTSVTAPLETKAKNQLLFNCTTQVKSIWYWEGSGSGKVKGTTHIGNSGSYKLTSFSTTHSDPKAIAFSNEIGSNENSTTWPSSYTIYTGDVTKSSSTTYSNNVYYYTSIASTTSDKTWSAFSHLSANNVLTSEAYGTDGSVKITVNTSNVTGTLKSNSTYKYYATDGTNTYLIDTTDATIIFKAPATGNWSVYAMLSDPYGLETVKSNMINV